MKEACSNCRFFRGEIVEVIKSLSTGDIYENKNEFPESYHNCDDFDHANVVCAHRLTYTAAETGETDIASETNLGFEVIKRTRSVESGICRRYPPSTGEAIAVFKEVGVGIAASLFPVVKGREWCGEYQKASN